MGDQLSGFGLVSRPGRFLGRGAFNDDSPTASPGAFSLRGSSRFFKEI